MTFRVTIFEVMSLSEFHVTVAIAKRHPNRQPRDGSDRNLAGAILRLGFPGASFLSLNVV